MLVELDVFSGRPNPHWELDERGTLRLLQLQSRLTASNVKPPDPPALGYRGFVYTRAGAACRACQGYVRTSRAVLADPSFSIERFLIDHLPADLAPLGRKVASALGRTR